MELTEEQKTVVESTKVSFIGNLEERRGDHTHVIKDIESVISMIYGLKDKDNSLLSLEDILYGSFEDRTSNFELKKFLFKLVRLSSTVGDVQNFLFREGSWLVDTIVLPQQLDWNSSYIIKRYITDRLTLENGQASVHFIDYLIRRGISSLKIIEFVLRFSPSPYTINLEKRKVAVSGFGEFLTRILQGSAKSENNEAQKIVAYIHEIIFLNSNYRHRSITSTLKFLYSISPHFIEDWITNYCSTDENTYNRLSLPNITFLLGKDPEKYEPHILKVHSENGYPHKFNFEFYYILNEFSRNDYSHYIIMYGDKYLSESLVYSAEHSAAGDSKIDSSHLSIVYTKFLINYDKDVAIRKINDYLETTEVVFVHYILFLKEYFGEACVPFLIKTLRVSKKYLHRDYHETLFKILDEYSYDSYFDEVIQFCLSSRLKEKALACESISGQGQEVVSKAIQLLQSTEAKHRTVAAMILYHIDNSEVRTLLDKAVDFENNDAVRNVMIEAMASTRFATPLSKKEVKEVIRLADNRKKLLRWNEKWLVEQDLLPLYWKEGHRKLSSKEIRFLFYRMKQVKSIKCDVEARQLILNLEIRNREKFASQLLEAFGQSGANTQYKYYLSLASVLGGSSELNKLHAFFRKGFKGKRFKLCEYIISSIAMIGTDKALRIIDDISRKTAIKKPLISRFANAVLDSAAEDLGIGREELEDRVIPNFGFNNLYKELNIDGENYRAFLSNEFKFVYYTEDNKIRKSLPRAAPRKLKEECKEIIKEVRSVVKFQTDRLENCMRQGYQWPFEKWKELFLGNPIMFVYAQRLLWGAYDSKNHLIQSFYCEEDTSLLDHEDNEIELSSEVNIKILHPVDLNKRELLVWRSLYYDMSRQTIIPILNRSIIYKDIDSLDQHFTYKYDGKEIPKKSNFVKRYLDKSGWTSQTGGGGSLSFIYHYQNPKCYALVEIDGPVAWYRIDDVPAILRMISFHGENYNDKVLIRDVPDRMYSEVMSDIDALIKAT